MPFELGEDLMLCVANNTYSSITVKEEKCTYTFQVKVVGTASRVPGFTFFSSYTPYIYL